MAGTIRARFANGVLEPLEHLDVPEGEVFTITIIRLPVKEHRRQDKDEAVSDALFHLLPLGGGRGITPDADVTTPIGP